MRVLLLYDVVRGSVSHPHTGDNKSILTKKQCELVGSHLIGCTSFKILCVNKCAKVTTRYDM